MWIKIKASDLAKLFETQSKLTAEICELEKELVKLKQELSQKEKEKTARFDSSTLANDAIDIL